MRQHEIEKTVLGLAKGKGLTRATIVDRLPRGRATVYLIEGADQRRWWIEVVD